MPAASEATLKVSRLVALLLILTTTIGVDQATKQFATQQLRGRPPMSFLGDTVRVVYAENPGAFLGIGGQWDPSVRFALLTVVNSLFLLAIAAVLTFRWQMVWQEFAAYALLLAGGIGNLIDRVTLNGLVTDFLNLGIGPVRTGIFNVADVAITAGAIMLAVAAIWPAQEESPAPAAGSVG